MLIHVGTIEGGLAVGDTQEQPLHDIMPWIACDDDTRPLRAAGEKAEKAGDGLYDRALGVRLRHLRRLRLTTVRVKPRRTRR